MPKPEELKCKNKKKVTASAANPVTLWPFPAGPIRRKALEGARFLVVEDNLGQMVDDVRLAANGSSPVHFQGMLARHVPTDGGMIFPEAILAEMERLAG